MHLHGLEPGTHWLRVSGSTNWAKGAYLMRARCIHNRYFPNPLGIVLAAEVSSLRLSSGINNNWIHHTWRFLNYYLFSIISYLFPIHPENWTLFLLCSYNLALTEPALWSSFRLISISQLNASQHLHLWPINDIVYVEPQWRSYLRGSFTLRCLQRLSRPHVATQPCPWQNNWYTRGASIPVLSY